MRSRLMWSTTDLPLEGRLRRARSGEGIAGADEEETVEEKG